MNIKEFCKKHKKKLLIAGGVVVTGTLLCIIGKNGGFKKNPCVVTKAVLNAMKETDIQIPEVGKDLGVYEYFQEEPFLRGMFIETYAWKLGDLGKALIDNFEANPDCPIAITLEYVNN